MATTGQATDDLKVALLDPSKIGDEDLEKGGGPQKSSCLQTLEERWRVQVIKWGPQIDFVVRFMLVASFLDDSVRTAMHPSELAQQVLQLGFLNRLPKFLPLESLAAGLLLLGLIAQTAGTMGVLSLKQTDVSTKALLGWTIAQPVLYGQLFSNAEFLAGSVSLAGGLLILRAHFVDSPNAAKTQLIGRGLLPFVWLYYAGVFFAKAIGYEETNDMGEYALAVTRFVGCIVLLVLLVASSFLVSRGLRSRLVAFLLALANLGLVCYRHPFFAYLEFKIGYWGYWQVKSSIRVNNPTVHYADGVLMDDWQIWGLHKYYFLIGLSTSGALLLLAQHGSGESAVSKNDIQRL